MNTDRDPTKRSFPVTLMMLSVFVVYWLLPYFYAIPGLRSADRITFTLIGLMLYYVMAAVVQTLGRCQNCRFFWEVGVVLALLLIVTTPARVILQASGVMIGYWVAAAAFGFIAYRRCNNS
ncbi:MAG: hypothetical protein GX139_12640 [Armatimonadetes bacterium]|nr:hypothetical protein [Armatimonadota bacterium]